MKTTNDVSEGVLLEIVNRIRTVHTAIIVGCVALIALAVSAKPNSVVRAQQQLQFLVEAADKVTPEWFEKSFKDQMKEAEQEMRPYLIEGSVPLKDGKEVKQSYVNKTPYLIAYRETAKTKDNEIALKSYKEITSSFGTWERLNKKKRGVNIERLKTLWDQLYSFDKVFIPEDKHVSTIVFDLGLDVERKDITFTGNNIDKANISLLETAPIEFNFISRMSILDLLEWDLQSVDGSQTEKKKEIESRIKAERSKVYGETFTNQEKKLISDLFVEEPKPSASSDKEQEDPEPSTEKQTPSLDISALEEKAPKPFPDELLFPIVMDKKEILRLNLQKKLIPLDRKEEIKPGTFAESFPDLFYFLPLIQKEKPEPTMKNLEMLKPQREEKQQIMGFELPVEKILRMWGYIGLIGFQLFLLANLLTIERYRDKNKGILPWVGFYDNGLSRFVVFCTTFALPILTVLTLINKTIIKAWAYKNGFSVSVLMFYGGVFLATIIIFALAFQTARVQYRLSKSF